MTIKLVVLYPHPIDEDEFEERYVHEHLPLMNRLVGSAEIQTYRTVSVSRNPPAFYRIAEIHFRDIDQFNHFVESGNSKIGRDSSLNVSTGGEPTFLLCRQETEASIRN